MPAAYSNIFFENQMVFLYSEDPTALKLVAGACCSSISNSSYLFGILNVIKQYISLFYRVLKLK